MIQPQKILIVDDHEIFRKSLKMLIKRSFHYCEIEEARHGIEFLDLIKKDKYQIVLMDIKMPKMNGIEATKLAIEKYPNLKILGISMFGTEEEVKSMRENGAYGFIRKGCESIEIIDAIKTILNGEKYFTNII